MTSGLTRKYHQPKASRPTCRAIVAARPTSTQRPPKRITRPAVAWYAISRATNTETCGEPATPSVSRTAALYDAPA